MHSSNQVAQQIAEKLLTIKAIQLNVQTPFTWASGLRAPIYCDNRKALAYPKARTFIKEALVTLVKKKFSKVEGIAGVATAGIPQGALVAESLQLPFLYVRNKAKTHGLENSIEGQLQKKQKLVVLEDQVNGVCTLSWIALIVNNFSAICCATWFELCMVYLKKTK